MEETTVLIVGAGPTGLALGALLGRMNVKVCAFIKDSAFPGTAKPLTTKLTPDPVIDSHLGERHRGVPRSPRHRGQRRCRPDIVPAWHRRGSHQDRKGHWPCQLPPRRFSDITFHEL